MSREDSLSILSACIAAVLLIVIYAVLSGPR